MSQDEHPTEVRTCTTQGENKGRKQQRARAPLRQPSATAPTRRDTPKGSKTKSPLCVVLKTYHLTGIHHKTCLKHSNFLNRKLCAQMLPTWNTMATAKGQGTEGKQNAPKCIFTFGFTFSCAWYARFMAVAGPLPLARESAGALGRLRANGRTAARRSLISSRIASPFWRSVICHWDATSRAYFVLSRVRTPSAPLTQTDGRTVADGQGPARH